MILHTCIYTAPEQENPTIGDNVFVETERSYHFGHWLHISKNSSAMPFDFMRIFHDFIQPIRVKIFMSTGRPYHFGHLLQVSKKIFLTSDLYTSVHDLINVYSRRSGANNPQGTKF